MEINKLINNQPAKILTVIVLLAAVLRFFQLGQIPGSVNRDEAALGYNAYSIIQTGKDEFGTPNPLTFPSFGDYKLPGYIYGSIPFIKVFGLSDFSVRLLSAISGTLSIITIYYLTKELFKKESIALVASLSLAISPWAIFYSRTAFETNVATILLTTGLLLLIKGLKKPWLWIISAIIISYSLFTYNNPYIVGPVVLLVFFIFHYKKLFKDYNKYQIIIPLIILTAGALFALKTVWSVNAAKTNVTIFKSPEILEEFWDYRESITAENSPLTPIKLKLIGNKYVYYGSMLFTNILKNFSPTYLVQRDSSHIWNGIPQIGHFYVFDYLLLIIGCIALFKLKDRFAKTLIFTWLIAGVLPAALTIHKVQPNRGMLSFYVMHIIIAYGAYQLLKFKHKFVKPTFALVYIISLAYFINAYFIQFPKHSSGWYPNLGQAIHDVNAQNSDYVYISSSKLSEAYIYYLFYSSYDPSLFQSTVVRTKDQAGFYTVHRFGNVITAGFPTNPEYIPPPGSQVTILGTADDPFFGNTGVDQEYFSTEDIRFVHKTLTY